MWDDAQLNNAKYNIFNEQGSLRELNVGTIEITGANGGIYLMRPVPPFGGLGTDSNQIEGMKFGATVPIKNMTVSFTPRGFPVPDRTPSDQFVIHDFGNYNI